MRGRSLAAAAGFCVLVAGSAYGQGGAGDSAESKRAGAFPTTLPEAKAAAETATEQTVAWSPQEIQFAQARCAVLLKGLDVVAVPDVPLREGSECGAPAPMRLISVGKTPQVAFSPPPTVTCDMIAALHKWLQRDVQPLARKHMGAAVVRVETMSSYSCRNAYNRAHGRLSEHGRANAVDIGSFVTALGHAALVISDWGLTARDVAVAAAAASKSQKETVPSPAPVTTVVQSADKRHTVISVAPPGQPLGSAAAASITGFSIGIPGVALQIGGGSDKSSDFGLAPPNRLGGPKAGKAAEAASAPMMPDGRMDFLRAVHKAACKEFGTVLGPEANNAHKNHFHVDMAERPRGSICE